MTLAFVVASVILGFISLAVESAAGLPVFGLAFASASIIRELKRQKRRKYIFAMAIFGIAISSVGTGVVLVQTLHG